MECPVCGMGQQMDYVGIEDGYGMYADLSCDLYVCPVCDHHDTGECVGDNLIDVGYECIMCGKPTVVHPGERCSKCKQVWNS